MQNETEIVLANLDWLALHQGMRLDFAARAVVLDGEARLAFHGVDRIIAGTSTLLPEGGRINLTLRRVTLPPPQQRSG